MLDSKESISNRIKLINNFDFKNYKALVKTHFIIEKNTLFYIQEKILKIEKNEYIKDDFLPLVSALEYFNKIGFVHGDINKRNILWTKEGFKIVDYEPSLMQNKNGVNKLMVTIPYVFKEDLKSKNITTASDKISFLYFLLRLTNKFSNVNVVKLSKNLNHYMFLKINYKIISDMSYNDVLEYAFNSNKYQLK